MQFSWTNITCQIVLFVFNTNGWILQLFSLDLDLWNSSQQTHIKCVPASMWLPPNVKEKLPFLQSSSSPSSSSSAAETLGRPSSVTRDVYTPSSSPSIFISCRIMKKTLTSCTSCLISLFITIFISCSNMNETLRSSECCIVTLSISN